MRKLGGTQHARNPACSSRTLIVVDNGSSDSTSHVLREFARSVSFPVIILNEAVPGLGRARNRGWRAASGEIIAFTDDDCYVLPDFLDSALEAFVIHSSAQYAVVFCASLVCISC